MLSVHVAGYHLYEARARPRFAFRNLAPCRCISSYLGNIILDLARAARCCAPNSPAPAGSHWYFRPDRANQRNCWHLRASDQPPQPEAAQATSDAPRATHTIAFKKPAAASPSAPMSTSPDDSAAPALPPVKPQRAPMSSATTDQRILQSAQEGNPATSIP
jgi:hypothetical protein